MGVISGLLYIVQALLHQCLRRNAYPTFQDAFVDYMSECEHGPVFPIGGLGDGSIVFLDLESGRVQGYNCDYSNLEEIANSFSSLLLSLVEQALEIGKLCGES